MALVFGASGVTPSNRGQPTTVIDLPAGQVSLIPPGTWIAEPGLYTAVQEFDPVTGIWRSIGNGKGGWSTIHIASDGVNFRLANQTGCAIGALITNAGTGYTSAPTVTASGGASIWQAIVGGAVNTSVTVTNGGSGYTYPPQVLFSAPSAPGIQATGYCSLTSGAVSSVTIVDQGAGYASAPTITFRNDPREGLNNTTIGVNAQAVATLTGAGTVTGLVCVDHGNAVTSLPTLSFSGGGGSSAAATTIMCWSITAYTVTSAGSGYSGTVEISGLGGFPGTSPAYTNVSTQSNLLRTRKASILGALSAGTITATGQTVYDGGIYPGSPTQIIYGEFTGTSAAVGNVAFTMGGQNDVSLLIAA